MQLTDPQKEILVNAWMLGPNRGQVLADWAYPHAHDLAEARVARAAL